MVDDPEKTHTLNWTIQEPRSLGMRTTQREKTKEEKETFASNHIYHSANMQA
jgi:hypothetical protein